MDRFDYAYAALAYGCLAAIAVLVLIRWIIGAICRAEINKYLKGHVISRRGHKGRFVGFR